MGSLKDVVCRIIPQKGRDVGSIIVSEYAADRSIWRQYIYKPGLSRRLILPAGLSTLVKSMNGNYTVAESETYLRVMSRLAKPCNQANRLQEFGT